MKKKELIARIRYIEGKPEPKKNGKWDDDEQFCIEIYDHETKTWEYDGGYTLYHAKEFPEQKEANFLHYSFIKRILNLLEQGYKISEAKSANQ